MVYLNRTNAATKSGSMIPITQLLYVLGNMNVFGMQTIGRITGDILIRDIHTNVNELIVIPEKALTTDLLIKLR